jgi:hypothetical protein
VSIIDWIVAGIDGIDAAFLKSFQIIRVLKVLRVSRVIRLVKALKGLEKLIQIAQWSFSALMNILFLMIIFYCICALIGCYLYDGEKQQENKDSYAYINEYYNMDNFYYSYLLIFRCATGENWPNIMMEMAFRDDGRGEGYSIAFFILSNFVTAIILLNLLLMVILQQYDEFNDKKYNPIDKYNSFLTEFNNAWNKFSTEEDEGFRIKNTLVTQFFLNFNWKKLNFPEKGKLEKIKMFANSLQLINDSENYVYYHDMIFKILYKQMGSQIYRNDKENNLIFRKEKELQKKIKILISDFISKRKDPNNQKLKNTLTTYNPFIPHIYYKHSFSSLKLFMNFYKENNEILLHQNIGETVLNENFDFDESLGNGSSQFNESSNISNSNSISNSKDKNGINSFKVNDNKSKLYSKIKEENNNSESNSSFKIGSINMNKDNHDEDQLLENSNNKENDIINENESINDKNNIDSDEKNNP